MVESIISDIFRNKFAEKGVRDKLQQIEKVFGLPEFRIKRYEMSKEEINLYVEIKAKKARCPRCGRWSKKVHQYHERKKVRDLDVFGRKCYLIFEIRRFECEYCKNPFTERLNSIDVNSEYTKRFEDWVVRQPLSPQIGQCIRLAQETQDYLNKIFILFPIISHQALWPGREISD